VSVSSSAGTITGACVNNNKKHKVVLYDDLMDDPKAVATDACEFFDSSLLSGVESASGFISSKLRNHKASFGEDTQSDIVFDLSKQLYDEACRDEIDFSSIAQIHSKYAEYKVQMDSVLIEHLSSVKQSEVFYKKLFYDAYRSLWWKIAWPIKKVEQFFHK
jgi:hypothetical protein